MAKLACTENSLKVLNYLKETQGQNQTTADIAEALGMEKKSIEGIVTSGLGKKGYAERVPATIELEDGTPKAVKFVKITDKGMAYDHEAAVAADAAASAKVDAE